jgi:hypothetical protein
VICKGLRIPLAQSSMKCYVHPKGCRYGGSLPRIFCNFLRLIPNLAETIAAINAARIAGKTDNGDSRSS